MGTDLFCASALGKIYYVSSLPLNFRFGSKAAHKHPLNGTLPYSLPPSAPWCPPQ